SSRRRHTRSKRDWSSEVCSSDLALNIDDSYFAGRAGLGVCAANRAQNQSGHCQNCVSQNQTPCFHFDTSIIALECAANGEPEGRALLEKWGRLAERGDGMDKGRIVRE